MTHSGGLTGLIYRQFGIRDVLLFLQMRVRRDNSNMDERDIQG